jgi:AAA domain-containing protein
VLPGIEITSVEGVHVIAIFPSTYGTDARTKILGWLEIPGSGDTRVASRCSLKEIFTKVDVECGIIIVPHPFTEDIGLLDGARKMSTKIDWLESGYIRLMQVSEEKVSFIARDDRGNWINRYVLGSASPAQRLSSTYCLAPFSRSDAHKPSEIADGCSWFRMAEPTVEGLKQVGCEPRTRISRTAPTLATNNVLLGMRVFGGYSNGEFFRFNEGLNCIVGQNYAGKSAVFDYIRFCLGTERECDFTARTRLLSRLYGILGTAGSVELYVRQAGRFYVVKRVFDAVTTGQGQDLVVQDCTSPPLAYEYNEASDILVPVQDFHFPLEVYEQHRISRLRDDVARQLEMVDEFAALADLKYERAELIRQLGQSADVLGPLIQECNTLHSELANLAQLEAELAEKEKLLPGEEEQRWTNTAAAVQAFDDVIDQLLSAASEIPAASTSATRRTNNFERLFGLQTPTYDREAVVSPELLARFGLALEEAAAEIEKARQGIVDATTKLRSTINAARIEWDEKRRVHEEAVRIQLRKAGIDSPQEVIDRVRQLRLQIGRLKAVQQPRLVTVAADIDRYSTAREALLVQLKDRNEAITLRRQQKAAELTTTLGGQIKISVKPRGDTREFREVLNALCAELASKSSYIHQREGQLDQVTSKIGPIKLSRALQQKGAVTLADGKESTLTEFCGITENTQNFLCRIADDIHRLNRLQTTDLPDVPTVLVRRRGESTFADLRTGLSPGEQSAAILTLALQARAMPLMLDQPEDELGYSYVVHLIVPKILEAKFSRQVIVITHNANIPVLGDADYVTKMENQPNAESGRACTIASAGSFEDDAVTHALIDLEGGQRAFDFRRHRYALPRSPSVAE